MTRLCAGEIPDAAFIHAARKRRQMARELGGETPLVETDSSNKRMVREDEQGGSDEDEDEKRIVFSGVKQKTQRQKIAEEIGEWTWRPGPGIGNTNVIIYIQHATCPNETINIQGYIFCTPLQSLTS